MGKKSKIIVNINKLFFQIRMYIRENYRTKYVWLFLRTIASVLIQLSNFQRKEIEMILFELPSFQTVEMIEKKILYVL